MLHMQLGDSEAGIVGSFCQNTASGRYETLTQAMRQFCPSCFHGFSARFAKVLGWVRSAKMRVVEKATHAPATRQPFDADKEKAPQAGLGRAPPGARGWGAEVPRPNRQCRRMFSVPRVPSPENYLSPPLAPQPEPAWPAILSSDSERPPNIEGRLRAKRAAYYYAPNGARLCLTPTMSWQKTSGRS